MKNLLNTLGIDAQLDKIEKLKWLPWIGNNFFSLPIGKKMLIIGESHYLPSKEEGWYDDVKTRGFTRAFVSKQIGNINNDMEKILLNLQKMLLNEAPSLSQKTKLWDSITYYNFIQRELKSSSSSDRPTSQDFANGWQTFFEILEVLKPDICLFAGVSASNENGKFIETAIKHKYNCPDKGIEKVTFMSRGVRARKIIIVKDQKELPILFILHPCCRRCFIPSEWRLFLDSQIGDYLNWLGNSSSILE